MRPGRDRRGPRPGRRPARPDDRTLRLDEVRSLLRGFEAPIRDSDFGALQQLLSAIAGAIDTPSIAGLERLGDELRGKLFTGLLRVTRFTAPDPDAAKDQARKSMHVALAAVWRALGDSTRAAHALAAAGRTDQASKILRQTGDWREVAELREREGRHADAARLFEEKGANADAARCHRAAGDPRSWLRCLHKADDGAALAAAARELSVDVAIPILLKLGQRPLAVELLSTAGRHGEVAAFQETWQRFRDAGASWEKAGEPLRALECYQRGKDRANAERLLEAEVAKARVAGGAEDEGRLLVRFGRHQRAADLVAELNPDLAHQWLVIGKLDPQALALAQHQARSARERKC